MLLTFVLEGLEEEVLDALAALLTEFMLLGTDGALATLAELDLLLVVVVEPKI